MAQLMAFAACAAVVAPPARAQARPMASANPALAACAAANRQALADLTQALQATTRSQVANPMTISRLQGLDAKLRKLRDNLPRNARTPADCEQMAQDLAAERDTLVRLGGNAPAGNAPAGNAVRAGGGSGGAMSVADVLAAASPTAPTQAVPSPTPGTVTTRLAATPPSNGPTADSTCRDTAVRAYNALAQVYTGMTQPGQLQAEWGVALKSVGDRLTQLHAAIAAPPTTTWNCAQVTLGLGQAQVDLAALAPAGSVLPTAAAASATR